MLSQAGALLVKKSLRKSKNYKYEPMRELLASTNIGVLKAINQSSDADTARDRCCSYQSRKTVTLTLSRAFYFVVPASTFNSYLKPAERCYKLTCERVNVAKKS